MSKAKWLGLVVVLCLTTPLVAQVTQEFCIAGNSNGTGWTWTLTGVGLPAQRVTTDGVKEGGPADLANKWVDSINAAQGDPPAYVAEFTGVDDSGRACFSITASRDFTLFVNKCDVTNGEKGCSFNPTVIRVIAKP